MTETVELPFASGGSISVEVVDASVGTRGGLGPDGDMSEQVTESFESTLGGIRHIAESLQSTLRDLAHAPDAVTVDFGINFSASAGLIIASGTGGANLNISMRWDGSRKD